MDKLADVENANQLMHAYAQGDACAFDQLYAQHSRMLMQYIANSCGSQADAQEIYQEVWVKVIKQRDRYDSTAPFKAWLFTIARNTMIDRFRSDQRAQVINTGMDEPDVADIGPVCRPLEPDEIARQSQSKESLYKAMQTLTEAQREAVLLKHIGGFSIKEIATLQRDKPETIKSRLRYAFSHLRKTLRCLPESQL